MFYVPSEIDSLERNCIELFSRSKKYGNGKHTFNCLELGALLCRNQL